MELSGPKATVVPWSSPLHYICVGEGRYHPLLFQKVDFFSDRFFVSFCRQQISFPLSQLFDFYYNNNFYLIFYTKESFFHGRLGCGTVGPKHMWQCASQLPLVSSNPRFKPLTITWLAMSVWLFVCGCSTDSKYCLIFNFSKRLFILLLMNHVLLSSTITRGNLNLANTFFMENFTTLVVVILANASA